MNKFKIGDRVRLLAGVADLRPGMIGTVIEDDDRPFVAWDDFSSGHDACTDDGSRNKWSVHAS